MISWNEFVIPRIQILEMYISRIEFLIMYISQIEFVICTYHEFSNSWYVHIMNSGLNSTTTFHTVSQKMVQKKMLNDKTELVKEAKNDKASHCCWSAYQKKRLNKMGLSKTKLGEMRIGEMRLGKMRLGEMRLGKMLPNHSIRPK